MFMHHNGPTWGQYTMCWNSIRALRSSSSFHAPLARYRTCGGIAPHALQHTYALKRASNACARGPVFGGRNVRSRRRCGRCRPPLHSFGACLAAGDSRIHTHTRARTHTRAHTHTNAHTHTHTHTQGETETRARAHTRAHTHTHTHTHTDTQTHAHARTRTHARAQTHGAHMRRVILELEPAVLDFAPTLDLRRQCRSSCRGACKTWRAPACRKTEPACVV